MDFFETGRQTMITTITTKTLDKKRPVLAAQHFSHLSTHIQTDNKYNSVRRNEGRTREEKEKQREKHLHFDKLIENDGHTQFLS